ncbi:MAG TPA: tetratricopeptide repeat protein [Bryobacteraceae bacterium]|jgi:tetratricopeptide (TPR) repeat protein
MRRIAILPIGLAAALAAFSQTAPAPKPAPAGGAAAPAAGAAAPAAPGAAEAPKGPHPKSAEENAALLEMFKAQDPDTQIKAAQDILDKYPDTDYKAQVELVQATAYHEKKDDPKAIVAGEESLKADPKSYEALLLLAEIYSRTTRSTDLDMDDRLAKSDKYAHDALTVLATAEKPKPDITDEQWNGVKQGETERAYMALGLSAILKKKYDEAKTNLDKAISLYPDPLDMLYVERAYTAAKRYDDALAWIAKVEANPAPEVAQLKKIAGDDKTRVEALKKKAQ